MAIIKFNSRLIVTAFGPMGGNRWAAKSKYYASLQRTPTYFKNLKPQKHSPLNQTLRIPDNNRAECDAWRSLDAMYQTFPPDIRRRLTTIGRPMHNSGYDAYMKQGMQQALRGLPVPPYPDRQRDYPRGFLKRWGSLDEFLWPVRYTLWPLPSCQMLGLHFAAAKIWWAVSPDPANLPHWTIMHLWLNAKDAPRPNTQTFKYKFAPNYILKYPDSLPPDPGSSYRGSVYWHFATPGLFCSIILTHGVLEGEQVGPFAPTEPHFNFTEFQLADLSNAEPFTHWPRTWKASRKTHKPPPPEFATPPGPWWPYRFIPAPTKPPPWNFQRPYPG
jgi:hypothetical protein